MEIQLTEDGSHTLFIPEMNEHYHSVNGAVTESIHVYIQAGFNQCTKKEVRVLELGFGTGLNALLTCLEAEQKGCMVHYTALEKFPLDDETIQYLNYGAIHIKASSIYPTLHTCPWGNPEKITPHFSLTKINIDFADYEYTGPFDVVYYDAFAPDKQSEVWTPELFRKIYASMNPGGILTTYCAKGSVRRMMQNAGFKPERIPGPPGKREMLRANK